MKVIIKLCLVLSIAFGFTAASFSNVHSAEAASSNSCEVELKAAEKALNDYNKQVFKSLKDAIKAKGWIKGPITYLKQTLTLNKLAKKVKNLTKDVDNGLKCVLQPIPTK